MPTRVDKLEFLVLVDNSIERLQRLPPGFIHELPQHIFAPNAEKDELTGLPLTRFDNFCCGAHGLSIMLTTTIGDKSYKVLFDTGPEHLSIDRNVKAMKTDLTDVEAIVLSHWHVDHSGGILRTLEMRNEQAAAASLPPLPPLRVDVHPDRPIRRGLAPPPKYNPITNWGPDPTFAEMAAANGAADPYHLPHEITAAGTGQSTGVCVSGEIPRVHPYERGLRGAITWMVDGEDEASSKGEWMTDEMIRDERYIAVDVKGKGLVLFSACSHAGISNVISDAIARFDRPVHMVVGGLHLVPVEVQPVDETVDFLVRRVRPQPDWVLPLHCTGMAPRAKLVAAFGNKCVPAGVGMKVVVEGDEAREAELDEVDVKVVA